MGLFFPIQEQSYTAFFFVIFFFMQKSCGQFVDVSDLNLVVCYLILTNDSRDVRASAVSIDFVRLGLSSAIDV